MMTTAVPSSEAGASASRHMSSPAVARRAPVLLRLPALHSTPPESPPPAPKPAAEIPPTEEPRPLAHVETAATEEADHEEQRREHRSSSRRERKTRPPREAPKKAGLSQWALGGCMLAAGILGFFALSGDFGGSDVDEPAPDGWRQRAEMNAGPVTDLGQPQFSPETSITVNREPITAPPPTPSLSDPAEGEVVQTAPSQSAQGTPNFMGAPSVAANPAEARQSATAPHQDLMTRPTSLETADQPPAANSQSAPGESAPAGAYPSTGAAGLSPMAPPVAGSQGAYPVTRLTAQPAASVAGIAAPAPPPVFTNSSAYPSTGYPTTGAAAPFTNPTPSAMNPRYERIR